MQNGVNYQALIPRTVTYRDPQTGEMKKGIQYLPPHLAGLAQGGGGAVSPTYPNYPTYSADPRMMNAQMPPFPAFPVMGTIPKKDQERAVKEYNRQLKEYERVNRRITRENEGPGYPPGASMGIYDREREREMDREGREGRGMFGNLFGRRDRGEREREREREEREREREERRHMSDYVGPTAGPPPPPPGAGLNPGLGAGTRSRRGSLVSAPPPVMPGVGTGPMGGGMPIPPMGDPVGGLANAMGNLSVDPMADYTRARRLSGDERNLRRERAELDREEYERERLRAHSRIGDPEDIIERTRSRAADREEIEREMEMAGVGPGPAGPGLGPASLGSAGLRSGRLGRRPSMQDIAAGAAAGGGVPIPPMGGPAGGPGMAPPIPGVPGVDPYLSGHSRRSTVDDRYGPPPLPGAGGMPAPMPGGPGVPGAGPYESRHRKMGSAYDREEMREREREDLREDRRERERERERERDGRGGGMARSASRTALALLEGTARAGTLLGTLLPRGRTALPANQEEDTAPRPQRRGAGISTQMFMVLEDIDQLLMQLPPRPGVLKSHDVNRDDWDRFVTDLAYAWSGEMGRALRRPRRSHLLVEIVETWNLEFFMRRGIEAILYKGRERRTGDIERAHSEEDDEDEYEYGSDSSDDDDTDYSERAYMGRGRYSYKPGEAFRYEEAARGLLDRYRQRRELRRTRRREQERTHRAPERRGEKLWSLYFTAIRYHGHSLV
ncbi:hypothetical protein DACRYDRAFT_19444 [Dacryopinax primogenitus]|uniref:Uncharacterized protein n=1 Tax=Dacryopinax primogenitus (strain DJM 731) TaxID=1858805 RepID=M5G7H0_DACPD|nr:uncharacterized protein DACRYDRAFT_19444 [Dacryopinax primogenitus]EJU06161.1 hypothetical protein DACRYDRAFT_19444 [Dacryopinax primogenitus]